MRRAMTFCCPPDRAFARVHYFLRIEAHSRRAIVRKRKVYVEESVSKAVLTSGVIGLFTGPHHTSLSECSSFTIRLSEGERPVFAPLYAESAPLEVMAEPVSYTKASS